MWVGERVGSAAVVLFVLVLGSGSALAQSPEENDKALEHFEQAEAYMRVQAFAEAIAEYEAAYATVAKPGFLFNIGLAHEQNGNKAAAREHYLRYLELEPDGRKSVEARARALALERESEVDTAPANRSGARRPGRTKKISALCLGGVALVGIGLGVKFAVDVGGKQDQLDELTAADAWNQDVYEERNSLRQLSLVSFGVGATAAIGGGLLYYLGARDAKRSERKVALLPVVNQSSATLAMIGRF
jgi:tetratricopeptide (TPR) repeat protein